MLCCGKKEVHLALLLLLFQGNVLSYDACVVPFFLASSFAEAASSPSETTAQAWVAWTCSEKQSRSPWYAVES